MRSAFASLGRNLAAGLRLALFMPVSRTAFRITPGQLVLLAIVSATIDVDADWVRAAHESQFSILGLHSELFALGLLVITSSAIAIMRRDDSLLLALPVVVLASFPAIQVASVIPDLPQTDPSITDAARQFLDYAFRIWVAALCARAVYVCLDPQLARRRAWALGGGLLLVAPIWFPQLLGPLEPWWREVDVLAAAAGPVNPASEPALAAQQFLMDRALDALDDEQPGVSDLYFVGFSPDARRRGFAVDAELAKRTMDERWNTRGRSVLLVNSPTTVAERPYATITNLRETLLEIGDIIDPDDDVVMVYLTGDSGRDHALAAINPPLELVPLSPGGLRQLFDAAGIRWRIVVVSTCYAGAWVDALKDADTAVIASSAADVHADGCEGGTGATAFGDAFWGKGMRRSGDIARAFDATRAQLAGRGAAAPVMWMGPAIGEHLKLLAHRGGSSRVVARAAIPVRYR
ncbi:MAG TPA: C13 family peptidase [Casimicrobiaceae bacterium]|nr:C13 family peptidase [Casimicrobiaceae bacterium]